MEDVTIDLGDGAQLVVSSLKIREMVLQSYGLANPLKRKYKKKGKRVMTEAHKKAIVLGVRKAAKERFISKYKKGRDGRKGPMSAKQRLTISRAQKKRWSRIKHTPKVKTVFTPKEVKFIIKNFGKMKRGEIAKILHKNPRQISDKVVSLRLQGVVIKRKYK